MSVIPKTKIRIRTGATIVPAFRSLLSCSLLLSNLTLATQMDDLIGYWDIKDKSGTLDTTVEIYPASTPDYFEAKVIKLHRPQDQGALCTACSGTRQNQPILGMTVLTMLNWHLKKEVWYGDGLDPDKGWEPQVRLRLTDNNTMEVCAFYKTDLICLDKDIWIRRQNSPVEADG